jgi:hypothetical protein
MFERFFRSVHRRADAIRIAEAALKCLSPVFFVADCAPEGKLKMGIKEDEFVISYVYGVVIFFVDLMQVADDETKGYVLLEVYDRLFPGHGRAIVSLCDARAMERADAFIAGMKTGFGEMSRVAESEGASGLPGLLDYLATHWGYAA